MFKLLFKTKTTVSTIFKTLENKITKTGKEGKHNTCPTMPAFVVYALAFVHQFFFFRVYKSLVPLKSFVNFIFCTSLVS